MEVLLDGICMLCSKHTSVLGDDSVKPILKFIDASFFEKNKAGLKQFQEAVPSNTLCVLCAQKIIISYKVRDLYDEGLKNCTNKAYNKCIICGLKHANLVLVNCNPNDILVKLKLFKDCSLYSTVSTVLDKICFSCIFSVSIWFDIIVNIQSKLNTVHAEEISSGEETENQNENLKESPVEISVKNIISKRRLKLKRNYVIDSSSEEEDAVLSKSLYVSTPTRRQLNLKLKKKRNEDAKKHFKSISPIAKEMELRTRVLQNCSLNLIVKKQLKHLKTIMQMYNEIEWSVQIQNDKKMFAQIPYVLIIRDRKVNTRPVRRRVVNRKNYFPEDLEIDIIEISDVDEETISSKPIDIYNCNICDKIFNVAFEYKAHVLWHDKPETIKIDITNYNLPQHIKASKFNNFLEYKRSHSNSSSTSSCNSNSSSSISSCNSNSSSSISSCNSNSGNCDSSNGSSNSTSSTSKTGTDINKVIQTYNCNICEKIFNIPFEYKAHILQHEKPEIIKIDVVEYKLPQCIKASKFNNFWEYENSCSSSSSNNSVIDLNSSRSMSPQHSKSQESNKNLRTEKPNRAVSASDISRVLKKYLNESVNFDDFESMDFNSNEKNIESSTSKSNDNTDTPKSTKISIKSNLKKQDSWKEQAEEHGNEINSMECEQDSRSTKVCENTEPSVLLNQSSDEKNYLSETEDSCKQDEVIDKLHSKNSKYSLKINQVEEKCSSRNPDAKSDEFESLDDIDNVDKSNIEMILAKLHGDNLSDTTEIGTQEREQDVEHSSKNKRKQSVTNVTMNAYNSPKKIKL